MQCLGDVLGRNKTVVEKLLTCNDVCKQTFSHGMGHFGDVWDVMRCNERF